MKQCHEYRAGARRSRPSLAGTPSATVYDRTVATRNLDAAMAVLSNCTVSAYLWRTPWSALGYTMRYGSRGRSPSSPKQEAQ